MPMNPRLLRPLAPRQAPTPGPTDPDFASVSLLLHMDGANNSTTFLDSSSFARAVTASGNAKISTAQSKFGGASGYFDGVNTTKVSLASGTAFELSADFTVELWAYWLGTSDNIGGTDFDILVCTSNAADADGWLLLQLAGTLYFLGSTGNGSWVTVLGSGASLPANQWAHVALNRSGSDLALFLDGVNVASTSSATSYAASDSVYVGHYPVINGSVPTTFNGYIDELRITQGVARYTANFTPPTAPFPNQ